MPAPTEKPLTSGERNFDDNPPPPDTDHACLTMEHVYRECILHPHKKARRLGAIFEEIIYEQMWEYICSWTSEQYARQRSFNIPYFGRILFQTKEEGRNATKRPAFVLNQHFAETYGITYRPPRDLSQDVATGGGGAAEVPFTGIGVRIGADKDKARMGVRTLMHAIGSLMSSGRSVDVYLPFARLYCAGRFLHVVLDTECSARMDGSHTARSKPATARPPTTYSRISSVSEAPPVRQTPRTSCGRLGTSKPASAAIPPPIQEKPEPPPTAPSVPSSHKLFPETPRLQPPKTGMSRKNDVQVLKIDENGIEEVEFGVMGAPPPTTQGPRILTLSQTQDRDGRHYTVMPTEDAMASKITKRPTLPSAPSSARVSSKRGPLATGVATPRGFVLSDYTPLPKPNHDSVSSLLSPRAVVDLPRGQSRAKPPSSRRSTAKDLGTKTAHYPRFFIPDYCQRIKHSVNMDLAQEQAYRRYENQMQQEMDNTKKQLQDIEARWQRAVRKDKKRLEQQKAMYLAAQEFNRQQMILKEAEKTKPRAADRTPPRSGYPPVNSPRREFGMAERVSSMRQQLRDGLDAQVIAKREAKARDHSQRIEEEMAIINSVQNQLQKEANSRAELHSMQRVEMLDAWEKHCHLKLIEKRLRSLEKSVG